MSSSSSSNSDIEGYSWGEERYSEESEEWDERDNIWEDVLYSDEIDNIWQECDSAKDLENEEWDYKFRLPFVCFRKYESDDC